MSQAVPERRCDLDIGVALSLLIDRSGSMNGTPMEETKAAAQAAAKKLGDTNYLDVIGFDSGAVLVGRSKTHKLPSALIPDIARIQAGGGTDFLPALELAYKELSVVSACRKHVVLVTDGMAPSKGIRELVIAMVAEGITVSTVGLGTSVDEVQLTLISDVGGGRFHRVIDPGDLEAVLLDMVAVDRKLAGQGP